MQETPIYGLKKPEVGIDNFDIEVFNTNADKIDSAISQANNQSMIASKGVEANVNKIQSINEILEKIKFPVQMKAVTELPLSGDSDTFYLLLVDNSDNVMYKLYIFNGSQWIDIGINSVDEKQDIKIGATSVDGNPSVDQHKILNVDENGNIILSTDVNTQDLLALKNALITIDDDGNILVHIDDELSDESTYPVQNKIVKSAFDTKQDIQIGALPLGENPSSDQYKLLNVDGDGKIALRSDYPDFINCWVDRTSYGKPTIKMNCYVNGKYKDGATNSKFRKTLTDDELNVKGRQIAYLVRSDVSSDDWELTSVKSTSEYCFIPICQFWCDGTNIVDFLPYGLENLKENYFDKTKEVIADINNKLSGALKRLVVAELPTENIDSSTIYMLPRDKTEENNIYDEFMYIDNQWEKIGSTDVDLSGYQKKLTAGNVIYIDSEGESPSIGVMYDVDSGLSMNSDGELAVQDNYFVDTTKEQNLTDEQKTIARANIEAVGQNELTEYKQSVSETFDEVNNSIAKKADIPNGYKLIGSYEVTAEDIHSISFSDLNLTKCCLFVDIAAGTSVKNIDGRITTLNNNIINLWMASAINTSARYLIAGAEKSNGVWDSVWKKILTQVPTFNTGLSRTFADFRNLYSTAALKSNVNSVSIEAGAMTATTEYFPVGTKAYLYGVEG